MLGAATALWFIAIGLIFGASFEQGVPGMLLMIVFTSLAAVAFGGLSASIALYTGQASVVQGLFPLIFVILFLSSAFFPVNLLLEPAGSIAEYNPLSFIVEGIREPVIGSLSRRDGRRGVRRDRRWSVAISTALSAIALRRRLRVGCGDADGPRRRTSPRSGRWSAASSNEILRVPGAAIPGVLAPTIFFLGLTAVFGEPHRAAAASTPRATRASSSRSACCRERASPAPRPGSTSPATSSRAGSTACSPPPPRARRCWPGMVSRRACAR